MAETSAPQGGSALAGLLEHFAEARPAMIVPAVLVGIKFAVPN